MSPPTARADGALAFRPVDSDRRPTHIAAVSKKPHKVEETTAAYAAKKAAQPAVPATKTENSGGVRYANLEKIRQTNAKLIQVHRDVLQKLAQ